MGVIYFTTYYANQNKGRADSTLEIQNFLIFLKR